MQHSLNSLVRVTFALSISSLIAGCSDDLKVETATEPEPAPPVVTQPADDGTFTTQVDAADGASWVYFSFESGSQVTPPDPASSDTWDLGFQRFHIISNGGASGTGGAAVAILTDQEFDAVTTAPGDGYVEDQPDTDDDDTLANSAFEMGDGWYDYDPATNRLSPRANVYVVQTASGAHYKVEILDYYDPAGTSGHPTFAWAEL
jgi:heme-binding HmuY-like protein